MDTPWGGVLHLILTERFVLSGVNESFIPFRTNKRPQPLALFNCSALLHDLDLPIPILAVLVIRIEGILIKGWEIPVVAVEHPLADIRPVVEEDPSLRVERIPFAVHLDHVEGVPVPAVVGAEGVGTFQSDALAYIVGFQGMINTGAPSVLDHPIIDCYRLAVVGAVVLE